MKSLQVLEYLAGPSTSYIFIIGLNLRHYINPQLKGYVVVKVKCIGYLVTLDNQHFITQP